MKHLPVLAVVLALLGPSAAHAAAADLYTVPGVEVDATAESATAARDRALVQGQPAAWQRLFRRLTPPQVWNRQPALDFAVLQRMIRSYEVANERRSTTRYLAEITYTFDEGEVQRVLRQASVPFADVQARPVLVIPLTTGVFDPATPWAQAWALSPIARGLVPVILPEGDALDQPILGREDAATLEWTDLEPLAVRYEVAQVVIANATPDGFSAQLSIVSATGRQIESLAFARSTFAATADAAAQRIAEGWKARSAVDYSQRARITADVAFADPADWPRIRNRLAAVRTVTEVNLVGISVNEARLELTFFGRAEQLRDAMAQQNLSFTGGAGNYLLRLGAPAPAARP